MTEIDGFLMTESLVQPRTSRNNEEEARHER